MRCERECEESDWKHKTASDFVRPEKPVVCLEIADCRDFLKKIPDVSVQLICVDPPYNLDLADWDTYEDYIGWAASWITEAYRVLAKEGNMVIFGGTQFRGKKSGDLSDIIWYVRHCSEFEIINTVVWYYKNGMSAQRFFANRHEEAIWLAKSDDYYFDLDAVRVPYSEDGLRAALRDKRLNPENARKGKNPTNVWEIGRLNGNSRERVGHLTQKPIALIERFVRALSYPGSVVLDFFAGSGTVGRVCVQEGRHCLMCDSDRASVEYWERHRERMKGEKCGGYESVESVEKFWEMVGVSCC